MNLRKSRVRLLRVAFVCLVLMALFFGAPTRETVLLDFVCHTAGYLLLMAGLGLRLWAILYVGERKSRELITTGPYSVCRNPLYVGTVLLTLGVALSLENLAMGLFSLAVVVPLHIAVVLAEEKHLREIFGQEYVEYMRRTPRFWFRLSTYHSAPEVNVSVRALRRAVYNAIGVLTIPPLTMLVDWLQDRTDILPVVWRWP